MLPGDLLRNPGSAPTVSSGAYGVGVNGGKKSAGILGAGAKEQDDRRCGLAAIR